MPNPIGQFGLGGYMDQNVNPTRPQGMLQLDEIFRKDEETDLERKILFEQIMQHVRKKFPQWSPMAQHLHASGLLRQEESKGARFGRAFDRSQQDLQQIY